MPGKWDVLGLGAVAVDDLVYVDHCPAPDSKQPILHQKRQGGGLAGTSLVAVARLGGKAAYCGVLGDDELSTFTLHELEREGVDCSPCVSQAGARPVHSIIIVDQSTGSRVILFSRDGVMEPPVEALTEALVVNCRVLFVDHLVLGSALQMIPMAHRHGIPVIADVEDDSDPQLPAFIKQIDHLIVGIELAKRLTGEENPVQIVGALARSGRACSVVTAGSHGCWYCERGGQVQFFPAFQVEAVDTTGCGDVFHGAYEISIARGECVPRAIQIATAAAGLKATQPGGREGIPSYPTVMEFLAENGYGND
jgi:sugar/nucleoside kinase (ribokinase family)